MSLSPLMSWLRKTLTGTDDCPAWTAMDAAREARARQTVERAAAALRAAEQLVEQAPQQGMPRREVPQ